MTDSKSPLHMRTGLWILSMIFRALNKTLRVDISADSRQVLCSNDSPAILLIWHNRIAFTSYIKTRFRNKFPIYALVSPSKDGSILSGFFKSFGIDTERGSSNKNGARSAIQLIRRLRAGYDVCITPDGPRGPKYETKEGVFTIFEKSNSRMIIIRADFERAWTLKSWDAFQIPKPFSRIRLSAEEITSPTEFNQKCAEENLGVCEFLNRRLNLPA